MCAFAACDESDALLGLRMSRRKSRMKVRDGWFAADAISGLIIFKQLLVDCSK